MTAIREQGEEAAMTYFLVAIGGAIGSTLRFWLSSLIANWVGQTFPWGTLVINITGSFAIMFFAMLTAPDARIFVPGEWRQFFMVGICGGFTTFSSFSMQTLALAQGGEWLNAGLNVGLSVGLCLFGAWLGAVTANLLNGV
jgi:CrcB protein